MKFAFSILLLLVLLAGWLYINLDGPYITEEERQVNRILGRTGKIIEEKHDLTSVGGGVSMPGGDVRQMCLSFNTKDRLSKAELRKLLLVCADELLNQVNIDAVLRPALTTYPFTEKNVEIIIYNHDRHGHRSFFPDISNCELSSGKLEYASIDPEDIYRVASDVEETYQEAVEAAKQQ